MSICLAEPEINFPYEEIIYPPALVITLPQVEKGLKVPDIDSLQQTDAGCAIYTNPVWRRNVNGDHDSVVTPCKHSYRNTCILKWLSEHETCPMCRRKLVWIYSQHTNRSRKRTGLVKKHIQRYMHLLV
jgi:hypothetical protein